MIVRGEQFALCTDRTALLAELTGSGQPFEMNSSTQEFANGPSSLQELFRQAAACSLGQRTFLEEEG